MRLSRARVIARAGIFTIRNCFCLLIGLTRKTEHWEPSFSQQRHPSQNLPKGNQCHEDRNKCPDKILWSLFSARLKCFQHKKTVAQFSPEKQPLVGVCLVPGSFWMILVFFLKPNEQCTLRAGNFTQNVSVRLLQAWAPPPHLGAPPQISRKKGVAKA